MHVYPISGAAELCGRGYKVKGNAVVAFHPHTDYPFGDGPPRETNAVGYLIEIAKVPRNQNLVVKVKKGGCIRTRARVPVLDPPAHGHPDLVRIGKFFAPQDLGLVSRFGFSQASCCMDVVDRIALASLPRQLRDPRQMPTCRPTVSSGDVALRMVDCIRQFRRPSPISLFSFPSVSHPSSYPAVCHLMSPPDTPGSRPKSPTAPAGSLGLRRSLFARSATLDFQLSQPHPSL